MDNLFGMPTGSMVRILRKDDGVQIFLNGNTKPDGVIKESIVGYTGHRRGVRAEGITGKSYSRVLKSSQQLRPRRVQAAYHRWQSHYMKTHSAERLRDSRGQLLDLS